MVCATVALSMVMISTPRKLKTAAIKIAAPGVMERVETQVAMALGASVQPLTRMTPSVSRTETARVGLEKRWERKSERETVINASFLSRGQHNKKWTCYIKTVS